VAVLAGLLSGAAPVLLFGPVLLILSLPLILGALIQPSLPDVGRVFMAVGGMLVTVSTFLFLAPQALGLLMRISEIDSALEAIFFILSVGAIAVVVWLTLCSSQRIDGSDRVRQ
jgi:hypothetical protein